MTSWTLSIDYGTSNTAASVSVNGAVRSLRLDSNGSTMPSAVLLTPAGIVAGQQAINERGIDPASFEASPKRLIGQDSTVLGGRTVQVADLIAATLIQVRAVTVHELGGSAPDRVVLTHPEGWTPAQLGRLRDAAVRAGYPQHAIVTMSEPIAAAQHYAALASTPASGAVAVFDIGGGTCDVALLQRSPLGGFTVVEHDGNTALGGSDFDDRIYAWVVAQLRASDQTAILEALLSPSGRADYLTLRDSIRAAKEALSTYPSTRIPVRGGGSEAGLTLTRSEYEELIREDLASAATLLRGVLPTSGINALYLTGGGSKTPALHDAITRATGITPATLHDPKLVASRGALTVSPTAIPTVGPFPAPTAIPNAAFGEGSGERGTATRTRSRTPLILGIGIPVLALLLTGGGLAVNAAILGAADRSNQSTAVDDSTEQTADNGAKDSQAPDNQTAVDATDDTSVQTPDPEVTSPAPAVVETVTYDCWDDTTATADEGCSLLEGEAGAMWAFPVLDGANCVAGDVTTYYPLGAEELWQCTWSDLPNSVVNIARYPWGDDTEARWTGYFADFPAISATDVTDKDTNNVFGTQWESPAGDSSVGGSIVVLAYGYLPYTMEVFTSSDAADPYAEDTAALERTQYRGQLAIDEFIDQL